MDAVTAITRLGSTSTRAPLLELIGRGQLEQAVRAGSLVRVRRDLYALPAADTARVAAARWGGVVSHLSAAVALGWKVKAPPAFPEVTVRPNSHVGRVEGVRLHYASLTTEEVVDDVTGPVRTALDCARTLPFDEALAVVDSALRSRRVRRTQLIEAADAGSRTGRTRALRVIRAADARSANPFESVLRAAALGVTGFVPTPQGPVAGVGHADVADLRLEIALEAESWEFHGLREAFAHDVRRYTAMVRRGWLVVRFTWDDVMHRPDYVRAVIVDLVALRAVAPRGG